MTKKSKGNSLIIEFDKTSKKNDVGLNKKNSSILIIPGLKA